MTTYVVDESNSESFRDIFPASDAPAPEVESLPSVVPQDHRFSALYGELIEIARRTIGTSGRQHSIQATALVHEAYLKLREAGDCHALDRKGFLALAARVMRCVLVDHVRRRTRRKRGSGDRGARLDDVAEIAADSKPELTDLLALDDALRCLGRIDPVMEKIVELRFFLGLDVSCTARALAIPKRTVERKWSLARDALQRLLP